MHYDLRTQADCDYKGWGLSGIVSGVELWGLTEKNALQFCRCNGSSIRVR